MSELKPYFSGNLRDISVPKLIFEISLMKVSGVLKITRGSAKKDILINHGIPIKVTSNLLQEVFGRFLLKTERVTEDVYERTLKISFEQKRLHGGVLIENGYLTEADLEKYLKEQAYFKLFNLFQWDEGEYVFFIKDFISTSGDYNAHTVPALIYTGIKSAYTLERLSAELKQYNPFYLKRSSLKLFTEYRLQVSEGEKWLIDTIDGTLTVKEVIDMSPLDILETYRLLYALIVLNLFEVISSSAPITDEPPPAPERDEIVDRMLTIYHEMASKNYFEILGVSENADPSEIKAAYLVLAKKYHPDSFSSEKLTLVESTVNKIFDAVNKAYRVLSDIDKKKEYVESLSGPAKEDVSNKINDVMSAELQFQKGKIFLQKRDFKNALEAFGWAIKLLPEEGEYLAYYGSALLLSTEDKRSETARLAEKYLKKAAILNPSIDFPHLCLAQFYKTLNMKELALLHLKKAAAINPDNIEIRRELKLLESLMDKK